MWSKGSEVTFTVTGTAEADGRLSIGCKTFTESEIREVANGLTVKAPPGPSDGDVVKITRKSGTPHVLNNALFRFEGGQWKNLSPEGQRTIAKAWMETATNAGNTFWTVTQVAKAGKAV